MRKNLHISRSADIASAQGKASRLRRRHRKLLQHRARSHMLHSTLNLAKTHLLVFSHSDTPIKSSEPTRRRTLASDNVRCPSREGGKTCLGAIKNIVAHYLGCKAPRSASTTKTVMHCVVTHAGERESANSTLGAWSWALRCEKAARQSSTIDRR